MCFITLRKECHSPGSTPILPRSICAHTYILSINSFKHPTIPTSGPAALLLSFPRRIIFNLFLNFLFLNVTKSHWCFLFAFLPGWIWDIIFKKVPRAWTWHGRKGELKMAPKLWARATGLMVSPWKQERSLKVKLRAQKTKRGEGRQVTVSAWSAPPDSSVMGTIEYPLTFSLPSQIPMPSYVWHNIPEYIRAYHTCFSSFMPVGNWVFLYWQWKDFSMIKGELAGREKWRLGDSQPD